VLKEWMVTRTVPEIGEIFDRHGVSWGPYQTFREAVNEDPRCSTANPMFEELEQPGIGTYLTPGSPLDFSALERVPPTRAPLLGEHTDQILGEDLGLSETQIGRLHDDGVVAGPKLPQAV
jgi:2-methylfumaryl-CoA isomerase